MNTSLFEMMALLCILLFCGRLFIAIRLDRLRTGKNNFLIKFLVGIYLLEALLPILRKGYNREEHQLIRTANILVILFYLFVVSFLTTIWFLQ